MKKSAGSDEKSCAKFGVKFLLQSGLEAPLKGVAKNCK